MPAGKIIEAIVKIAFGEISIRRGPAHQSEGVGRGPATGHRHADELLAEHVERGVDHGRRFDSAIAAAAGGDDAFDEFVRRSGQEQAAAWLVGPMPRSADALEQSGDAAGGMQEDDAIDAADVDAELKAAARDDDPKPAMLESPFEQAAAPPRSPNDGRRSRSVDRDIGV